MRMLDLGCGNNKVEGAVGLDNIALTGVNIVHDLLNFPYPIENESYDIIHLRHVIEHFDNKEINDMLNECHRILNINGKLMISVPHVFSIAAFTDISHKSYFTFNSGKFWDKTHSKSYYKDRVFLWDLVDTDGDVTWFDWKGYQLRKIDSFLSSLLRKKIIKALNNPLNPSLADRLVQKYSCQFVEISWILKKTTT
ncbi:class I SAM-dependent methyltransferase [Candidatus Marinimicrobia bacterium]|nr:class I SAM-dependent methyltransferase [Candidatus Neomarinimicrobiota bacterium]